MGKISKYHKARKRKVSIKESDAQDIFSAISFCQLKKKPITFTSSPQELNTSLNILKDSKIQFTQDNLTFNLLPPEEESTDSEFDGSIYDDFFDELEKSIEAETLTEEETVFILGCTVSHLRNLRLSGKILSPVNFLTNPLKRNSRIIYAYDKASVLHYKNTKHH